MMPFDGHYDRDADIAWIVLPGFDGEHAVGHQEPWGVRETDERTGELVALEFWNAARQLPAALLDALPAPGYQHRQPTRRVEIEMLDVERDEL